MNRASFYIHRMVLLGPSCRSRCCSDYGRMRICVVWICARRRCWPPPGLVVISSRSATRNQPRFIARARRHLFSVRSAVSWASRLRVDPGVSIGLAAAVNPASVPSYAHCGGAGAIAQGRAVSGACLLLLGFRPLIEDHAVAADALFPILPFGLFRRRQWWNRS